MLRPDDFVAIKANWLPKDKNIVDTAEELNILSEAFVFVDDNPAEREIVRGQLGGTAVPEIGEVTDYIRVLDRSGYFETVTLSEDDLKRNDMYRANAQRAKAQSRFADYHDYLLSLEMTAEIGDFFAFVSAKDNSAHQQEQSVQSHHKEIHCGANGGGL